MTHELRGKKKIIKKDSMTEKDGEKKLDAIELETTSHWSI